MNSNPSCSKNRKLKEKEKKSKIKIKRENKIKSTVNDLDKFLSLLRRHPPPPLLAKSKSEVNMILKYFKRINIMMNPAKPSKSYAQASKQSTSISNMLKIKESFLALSTNQID